MRVRTAKKLAERIDLNYFKQAHGLRWWRYVLSAAVPAAAILWVGGYAVAGSRAPYSAGPVSSAHAFAERRCEVCHAAASRAAGFRTHVTDTSCMTCHDGPPHGRSQATPPSCATCHQEHGGRVQLAKVDDRVCLKCHAALSPDATAADPHPIVPVERFPGGHPEFAVLRTGAQDPGGIKFNHAVHMQNDGVRGPNGVERLQCTQCHRQEVVRNIGRRAIRSGLMSAVSYKTDCARCHNLYFDERVDAMAPHDTPAVVRAFMQSALQTYIGQHADEIGKPDALVRRVPLNFPRPVEPPARNESEWVNRRLAFDERLMWNKTCGECHVSTPPPMTVDGPRYSAWLPAYRESKITARWMPRASFDHAAHQMVNCQSCHAADTSRDTADVLMPSRAACATCHGPSKGAETRCFECHQYHDWAKARPVSPAFTLGDFK